MGGCLWVKAPLSHTTHTPACMHARARVGDRWGIQLLLNVGNVSDDSYPQRWSNSPPIAHPQRVAQIGSRLFSPPNPYITTLPVKEPFSLGTMEWEWECIELTTSSNVNTRVIISSIPVSARQVEPYISRKQSMNVTISRNERYVHTCSITPRHRQLVRVLCVYMIYPRGVQGMLTNPTQE